MRKHIYLLNVLILCCFNVAKSQDFKQIYQIFGKTSTEIISTENKLVSDSVFNSTLYDVQATPDGFAIAYNSIIGQKQTTKAYYFNKLNKCLSIEVITDLDNLGEQLAYMKNGFRKVNNQTLYSNSYNLKMVYEVNLKTNKVTFIYSKK